MRKCSVCLHSGELLEVQGRQCDYGLFNVSPPYIDYCLAAPGGPDEVVAALLAADGLSSPAADERVAALAAVRALMAAAPEALHAPLTTVLASELDTTAHDQVTQRHLRRQPQTRPEHCLACQQTRSQSADQRSQNCHCLNLHLLIS